MLAEEMRRVQAATPLVHCITNYVTVNDVANLLLACGASPIMSDDEGEVEQITSICSGLVINIGTLNERTIPAMHLAGAKAASLGHPVLLDPVGAGASDLRTQTALSLMRDAKLACIRGNASEIKTIMEGSKTTRGVDADAADAVTDASLPQVSKGVRAFAREMDCIIVISGATDLVVDGEHAYAVTNGDPVMSRITGSGCMLSALVCAYLCASAADPLKAALAAVCLMGFAGERAAKRVRVMAGDGRTDGPVGTSSFRTALIDAISTMTPDQLEEGARYEQVF